MGTFAIFRQSCAITASFSKLITLFMYLFLADRSSVLSFEATALVWDMENEPHIKDGACAHVPGLKKKK